MFDNAQKDTLDLTTKAYKLIRHERKRLGNIIVNTAERYESKKLRVLLVEEEVAGKKVLLYEA